MPKRLFQLVTVNLTENKSETFKLYPSAQDAMKNWLRKAEQHGVISGQEEIATCEVALISAGIHKARTRGSQIISTHDISAGWHEQLVESGYTQICYPPRQCYKRSIVERKEELKATLPFFDQLITRVE